MSDDRKREKIRKFAAMYGSAHSFESLTGRTQSAGPNIQTNVPKTEEAKDIRAALAKHLFGDPKDFQPDYTGVENAVMGRMVSPTPDYGPLKNPLVGEPDTLAARATGQQIPKHTWHCADPDGPVCQMCDEPFDNELGEFLFDAATVQGPWAVMDETCFNTYSRRMLGTGYGQKYQLQPVAGLPGGRAWVKVDG